MPPVMAGGDITRALTRIAHEILEHNGDHADLLLVGIPTRGVPLAQRLGALVSGLAAAEVPVGTLDIGPYRDDLDTRPTDTAWETEIPVDVSGRTVVLVDDVLFTGRTVRAALDAVVDVGRPGDVQLAILVDRGHREIPIRADYVGKNMPTSLVEWVTVRVTEIDGEDGVWISSLPEERSAAR